MSMDNERLVTATFEKEKSGADEQLNYTIYIVKDMEVLAKEVIRSSLYLPGQGMSGITRWFMRAPGSLMSSGSNNQSVIF